LAISFSNVNFVHTEDLRCPIFSPTVGVDAALETFCAHGSFLRAMSESLSERAKIEIQLGTYVEIAMVVTEEETLAYIKGRIADLEQRLRDIDG
jgi:hypothetical protein